MKICYSEDLINHYVRIENEKIIVEALDGKITIKPIADDNIVELRDSIYSLIKGTPCNLKDVMELLSAIV